jgi:hypothetical protein
MQFNGGPGELLSIRDSVRSDKPTISSFSVFAKDTHIYVPSSRYYVDMKRPPLKKTYSAPVNSIEVEWIINKENKIDFNVNE